MKSTIQRVLFAVSVAALGAGAVGTASAQTSSAPGTSPPHHMHHGQFRRFGGARLVTPLLRATRQLGKAPGTQSLALTAEQQTYIKGLLTSGHSGHRAGAQPQGPGLTVLGDPGNAGYGTAVQGIEAAATARIQKESALAQSIWNDLSTGQRAALPGILASIQAQEQARRAQWAGKHATSNG
ncbi:MAG: hypothetical protein WDM77_07085 [Steroidobacteraceae bacterium]